MPTGPRGERRPADVIGGAIMVARLSIGDMQEALKEPSAKVRSGKVGGPARAATLTPDERRDIARRAAAKRWGSKDV